MHSAPGQHGPAVGHTSQKAWLFSGSGPGWWGRARGCWCTWWCRRALLSIGSGRHVSTRNPLLHHLRLSPGWSRSSAGQPPPVVEGSALFVWLIYTFKKKIYIKASFLTTFFRKTTNVEVLGMLKKIHAAMELSMSAAIKRMLYRHGKTTDVMLVSWTHLTEELDRLVFIFWLFGGPLVEGQGRQEGSEKIIMTLIKGTY